MKVQLLVEVYASHDMKRILVSTENISRSFTTVGSPIVINNLKGNISNSYNTPRRAVSDLQSPIPRARST